MATREHTEENENSVVHATKGANTMNMLLDAFERLSNLTWKQMLGIAAIILAMGVAGFTLAGCGTLSAKADKIEVDWEPIVEDLEPTLEPLEAVPAENEGIIKTPLNEEDSLKRKLSGRIARTYLDPHQYWRNWWE